MKIARNLVGPQVRKVRYQLNLTQDELAAKLRVADAELYLLADVLGVAMADLFPTAKEVKAFVGSPEFKRN